MNKNSTLEKKLLKEAQETEFSYDEQLWSKLDKQLIPIRDEYNRRNKRKIAYWFLGLLLVSGTGFFLINNLSTKKTINSNNNKIIANIEINDTKSDEKANDISNLDLTKENKKSNLYKPENVINENESNKKLIPFIKNYNSSLTGNKIDEITYSNNFQNSNSISKNNKTKTYQNEIANTNEKNNISEIISKNDKNPISTINKNSEITNTNRGNSLNKELSIELENKKLNEEKLTNESNLKTIQNILTDTSIKSIAFTKKELQKKIDPINKLYIYGNAGLNISNPFKKAGYYLGIQLIKQINEKRIFVGLKVAHNNLNHQLIATTKLNTFPQVTDAVINKITYIQVPFGYQFKLGKKSKNNLSYLNLGFEPTLLTGLQTIYYDDNGVIGGPRTMVINSPLLKNAINKFNISFIAGINKQINNKFGYFLNAGYGLIDITNKEYYNKTSKNNNLKYIQAGVLLKIK